MRNLFKMIVGGVLALCVLNLHTIAFYYPPQTEQIYRDDCPTGRSERPLSIYASFDEGYGWGKTDENGYVNPRVPEKYDVVIMGGSNIQGLQMPQNKTVTGQLSKLLKSDEKTAYNVAASGWVLADSAHYLESVCRNLQPVVVAIEVQSLNNSKSAYDFMIEPYQYEQPVYSKLKDILYVVPYIRRVSNRILKYNEEILADNKVRIETRNALSEENSSADPNEFIRAMADIGDKFGVQILFYYHPSYTLKDDGEIELNESRDAAKLWECGCLESGIVWVDATDVFVDEYEKNHTLAYGFFNANIASGHMNENGHEMLAGEIYKKLLASEVLSK